MRTFTGVRFFPLDPRPEEICIEDIAHALSGMCRFGGHTREFYSVAQHSVFVSRRVPPQDAMAGLLHDASEAYLVDVPKPVKVELCDYKVIENRLMKVIAAKFDFQWPVSIQVELIDKQLCEQEKRELFENHPDWPSNFGMTVPPIRPAHPQWAKSMFLTRFDEIVEWQKAVAWSKEAEC